MITFLSFKFRTFINAVPNPNTSSLNSLYVVILYGVLWSGFSNIQSSFGYFSTDCMKNSFTVL